jgi:transcriptional regulator with XRE-family HTH domain
MLDITETVNGPAMASLLPPPNRLREWRKKRGFSQAELARRTNFSPGQIRKLEAGTRRLNQQNATRLAQMLWCEPGDLFTTISTDSSKLYKKVIDSPTHQAQKSATETAPTYRYRDEILSETRKEESPMGNYYADNLEKIATMVGNLQKQFTGLMNQVAGLSTQVANINERVTRLESQYANVGPRKAGGMS